MVGGVLTQRTYALRGGGSCLNGNCLAGFVNLNLDQGEPGWVGKHGDVFHGEIFLFNQPV